MKKIDYYEITKQKLKYLNYSSRSINTYLGYIEKFLNNINTEPSRLTDYRLPYIFFGIIGWLEILSIIVGLNKSKI